MRFTKINSIPYEILTRFIDVTGGTLSILLNPPRTMSGGMNQLYRTIPATRINKGIFQLKTRGLVEEQIKHGERYLQLTEKGRIELVRVHMKEKQKMSWDNKWRVVIFDIPEITRKDRDFLRRQLRWIGFLELQKSVWVFPYDIKTELKEFIRLCKIEFGGDIRFLVVQSIDSDKDLRQSFGLKQPSH